MYIAFTSTSFPLGLYCIEAMQIATVNIDLL